MLDGLKALIALEKLGTISEAAVELRLTQSAISKRLQALEYEIGCPLIEKDGRRVRLTQAGFAVLSRAKPLISEFENLRFSGNSGGIREFSIGVADSIAASWGPSILRQAMQANPGLKLVIHVHRSTLINENIKLGKYDLGLVTGCETAGGSIAIPLAKEEMVLIRGQRGKSSSGPILTIEMASATWREIGPIVTKHSRFSGLGFEFVESFTAASQMAREGFGTALVPYGVAKSLGFKAAEILQLSPKIKRSIQLMTRKTILNLQIVEKLSEQLPQIIGKNWG